MSTLETKETSRLIAADKVEGTAVYNPAGEKIGSIENIMIDKLSGKVAYAVMSFGGFLGIGDKHYPLPWSMLKYDPPSPLISKSLTRRGPRAPSFSPPFCSRGTAQQLATFAQLLIRDTSNRGKIALTVASDTVREPV